MIGSPAEVQIFDRDELLGAAFEIMSVASQKMARHSLGFGAEGGGGKTQVLAHLGSRIERSLGISGIYVDVRSYSVGVPALSRGQVARVLLLAAGYPMGELPSDDGLAIAAWHARAVDSRMVISLDNVDDPQFLSDLIAEDDRNLWLIGTRRATYETDTFLWLPELRPAAELQYIEKAFFDAGRQKDVLEAHSLVSKYSRGNPYWMTRLTGILLGQPDIHDATDELRAYSSDLDSELGYSRIQDGTLRHLGEQARTLYSRLAVPGHIRTTYAGAGALLGISTRSARLSMLELEKYKLIIRQTEDGFILHDLAREDAQTRSEGLSEKEKASVCRRMAAHIRAVCDEIVGSGHTEKRARLVGDLLQLSLRLFELGEFGELAMVLKQLDNQAINVGMAAEVGSLCSLLLAPNGTPLHVVLLARLCRARAHWHDGDFLSAIEDCNAALLIAGPDAEIEVKAELWLIKAFSYERKGELLDGLNAIRNAELYTTTPKTVSAAHRIRGAIHYRHGQYVEAVDAFLDARAAVKDFVDNESSARIANNIGFTLRAMEMPELAFLWLAEAMSFARSVDDWSSYLTSLVNYSFTLSDVGDLLGVRGNVKEALAIALQSGAKYEEARARWALALAEIDYGESDIGLAQLQIAYESFRSQQVAEANQLAIRWPFLVTAEIQ